MGKLDGKVVLVTGASRGIGKAIAVLFAQEGGKVACVARTLKEGDHPLEGSLERTVAEITAAGGTAMAVVADIGEYEQCAAAVGQVRKAYGPIDVLVNNAALSYIVPTRKMTPARWVRSFGVNVHAPFYLSQLVLEDMAPRKSGAIVNISSGAAMGPGRGPYPPNPRPELLWTLYGAEKAALERFTQGLALEVFADGVSVTAVSPSQVVPTPGSISAIEKSGIAAELLESPETMARAVLLLATEPVETITGRVTYSQSILQEFGWITDGKGHGVFGEGSGYSQI